MDASRDGFAVAALIACVAMAGCSLLPPSGGASQRAFAPTMAPQAEGGWLITTPRYVASVNREGYLTSLKVGEVETVEAFAYQPRAKLAADRIEAEADTLKVHLKGQGEATIDYRFRRDGVTITPTWRGGGHAEFQLTASPAVLGIELLNDKSVTVGADAMRFVERGEIRGVPAAPSSRNQMVRFHFPGFGLHAYVQAWGCPYNYESAGSIRERRWGRSILEANKAFPIILTIQPRADRAALPAVPFVPRTDKVCSLYYSDEPCTWTLGLGEREAWQYLLDAGVTRLDLSWRLTDIHDKPAGEGRGVIRLSAEAERIAQPVELKVPGTGYYQARFELTEPSGRMLPSSFFTRFTVIHRVAGMVNRDDSLAGKPMSDYAAVGMIGVGGIRESHNIGGFFSDKPQKEPDWVKVAGAEPPVWMHARRLDELFDRAASESKRYRLRWFFQANSRPGYATPAVYEAMACALVSRYKDRCTHWEVENEPNFGYTPENYVTQCVIPFAKGAKRADPNCAIMGPGGCGVRDTLRFMEHIYATGTHQWFDEITTHSYPGPGEPWGRFGNVAMLGKLREWMKAHGDEHKPLWQTEQGYRWQLSPKAEAARYAVRQFLQAWRLGIAPSRHYYFYPQSHGFESWYQVGGGEAGSEKSWLPVAAAQRFLAENTHGMEFVGDVPAPYKGITLARFTGAEGDVVAAWTFDFSFTLHAKAPGLRRIVGYMGNPLSVERGADGIVSLPLSGEPIYVHLAKGSAFDVVNRAFGRNLAAAAAGATATASSAEPKHPAAFANDGNWELWEDTPELPGRTSWMSGEMDPSPRRPDWLQITFPCPRTIDRMAALCYLPAVNASPRDFAFQVKQGRRWKTVASGEDEWSWVLYREFEPVTTTAVRLVVTGINDGWHGDRRWMHVLMGPEARNYTASKVLVAELEAYGPPPPVEVQASVALPRKTGAFDRDTVTVTATNRSDEPLAATARIRVPEGWHARPASLPLELALNEPSTATIELIAPAAVPTGEVPIDVLIADGKGRLLDATRVSLTVASPVELSPQMPSAIDEARQPLAVTIKNTANQALSGVVQLDLAEAGGKRVQLEQPFGPVQARQSTTVEFTAPRVRLVGSTWEATYTVTANRLTTTARQKLALRGWQVIGPFPNEGGKGFATAYGPEQGIDLAKSYEAPGRPNGLRWKPAVRDDAGFIDFTKLFDQTTNACAYATVCVRSARRQKALLSAGSDDSIKAWLNGTLAISHDIQRGAAQGQEKVPIILEAGWNQVLLKITQGHGGWGFYLDVLTPDGKPMKGLVYGLGDARAVSPVRRRHQ